MNGARNELKRAYLEIKSKVEIKKLKSQRLLNWYY